MTEEENTSIKTKSWSTIAMFETYEEASLHRDSIKEHYKLIKIKACDKTKNKWSYKVKAWPKLEENINKKSKKSKKSKKKK